MGVRKRPAPPCQASVKPNLPTERRFCPGKMWHVNRILLIVWLYFGKAQLNQTSQREGGRFCHWWDIAPGLCLIWLSDCILAILSITNGREVWSDMTITSDFNRLIWPNFWTHFSLTKPSSFPGLTFRLMVRWSDGQTTFGFYIRLLQPWSALRVKLK